MELTDKGFAALLKQGNEQAFEKVFTTYYKALHAYAFVILQDAAMAEELVQEVFFKIWTKRNRLNVQVSLKAYLYRSVHNECMDHLKHDKYKTVYTAHVLGQAQNALSSEDAAGKAGVRELEKNVQRALNDLPEQCRTIFQMSRFEGLKYPDIAARLGLSVKTVETQMSKALKRLRVSLAEFLPVLILVLWLY